MKQQKFHKDRLISRSLLCKMTDEELLQGKPEKKQAELDERKHNKRQQSRLGLPFALRLPLATCFGLVVGAALGIGHGSKSAALQFRAENSHRLPKSQTGWYLYHKSKNYFTALGGVKEGGKMGFKVGMWTGLFFAAENIFDKWRDEKDFLNTVGGSLTVAGGFSLWSKY